MLKKGIYITLNVFDRVFTPQLLNVFWGKCQKFTGQVTLDGKSFVNKEKKDFAYVPGPGKIPGGIKVCLFVTVPAGLLKTGKEKIQELKTQLGTGILSKHIRDLSEKEKAGLLLKLAQMKQPAIYILHDLLKDMPECDKSEMMDTLYDLKNSGCLTIDIITGSGVNIIPDLHAQMVCRHSTYEMLTVKNIYEQSIRHKLTINGKKDKE
jgi:ABC-type Mn2+/Zn2+ transport system ATPase subunit